MRILSALALCLCISLNVYPREYPVIPRLQSSDPVFKQYSDDVQQARRALATRKPGQIVQPWIYAYTASSGDSLMTIAARCAIPYDSIASLNRIPSAQHELAGSTILLPTVPGLYVPETAKTPLEKLLLSSIDPEQEFMEFTLYGNDLPRRVYLLPDVTFNGTVRAYFLTPTFRFPLPDGIVTSSFGMRKNPVTGNIVFHRGIDLAAPRGTPVLSCADGLVTFLGRDPVLGLYIIVEHQGNRQSLYGHLERTEIELHSRVKSGTILGRVGSTGQSTGPHLHFEIHENGVPKDPAGFIKGN